MADDTTTIPLIRTKLQRPAIVGDHVHRSQLLERLDQRRQRPLTLVAAPAGYGKSPLMGWGFIFAAQSLISNIPTLLLCMDILIRTWMPPLMKSIRKEIK